MPSSLPFVSAFHMCAGASCSRPSRFSIVLLLFRTQLVSLGSAEGGTPLGYHVNPATSYRDDSRDPPANAGPGLVSAGRNKHHFRVPVTGRIRAQLPHGGRAEVPLRE